MQEIYLDDLHLHSLNSPLSTNVKTPIQGIDSPEIRLDAYNNPGADGQTIANALFGGRLIVLDGWTEGDTAAAYRTSRQAVANYAQPRRDGNGRLIPRILKFTDLAGNQYRVNVTVSRYRNEDTMPLYSVWQMQLQATDFRLYSETEATTTITLPVSGGITLPATLPATFGASSGGSASVINSGTLSTPPVVKFYGPMANPRLTNTTTGRQMGLNLTLVSGDVVTVDMAKRTIIQGTNTNRMSAKTAESKFWMLESGANDLSLIATSFDSGYATITYRSAFSGT